MLATTISPLVLSTIFLSTTTLAAPTRTHCRCTIVSDTPSPANNWTPSDPLPTPLTTDICADLGPSLSHFRHREPSLYASYIAPSLSSPDNDHHRHPISSTVLRDLGRDGFYRSAQDHDHEPRPTARPQQRIECRSEPEPFSAYQGTFVNLWALQIIVAVSILACVAEGVHLVVRWLDRRSSNSSNQDAVFPEERAVQLPGAEKRLLAIPPPVVYVDAVPSPGAEKKLRSYTTLRFFAVPQSASGRREFNAYEEDDDDEVNRPVM